MTEQPPITHADRVRLEALRYAVNDEAAAYVAIMRGFTGGVAGLLSDQSAAEVATRLAVQGFDLDVDTVESRLSYLVSHGNLARSPRETEARSIKEYLSARARYQLTQRGELVHRQVEELLGSTEAAREVSSEMLGAILQSLLGLTQLDDGTLAATPPDVVSREVTTLFAQFERLVESTRDFYTYLSQVLVRYDLDREEFQTFKSVLLDYLSRFVEEVALHMPQVAEALARVQPRIEPLLSRADEGQRLVGVDGARARRARGLDSADWQDLRAWFLGESGRASDAAQVRTLATQAMRALLVNLRRIATTGREVSRYSDLVRLARWMDEADDEQAHALWASAFGLYSCRHLAFPAGDHAADTPATSSWWRAPVAEVPVSLRTSGERAIRGRSGRSADFTVAKARRVAERVAAEHERDAAYAELRRLSGRLDGSRLSDAARTALLDLYARALAGASPALSEATAVDSRAGIRLRVVRGAGHSTVLTSPAGRLELVGLALTLEPLGDELPGTVEPTGATREQSA